MNYKTLEDAISKEFDLASDEVDPAVWIKDKRIDTMRIKDRIKLEEEHPNGVIVCITNHEEQGIYLLWNPLIESKK